MSSCPENPTSSPGVSKISLDADLVNTLLAMYANQPDGPQLHLKDGRLQVIFGQHSLDVQPLQLREVAKILLDAGPLGKLNLSVDLLSLTQQGLEVQLRHQG